MPRHIVRILIGPGIPRESVTELAQFRTGYILVDGECGEKRVQPLVTCSRYFVPRRHGIFDNMTITVNTSNAIY